MKLFDSKFFKLFLVLIVALAICIPSIVTAKEYKFACSLGWMENESRCKGIRWNNYLYRCKL